MVPSPGKGQLTGRDVCFRNCSVCSLGQGNYHVPTNSGVQLLTAQHLVFQTPCFGAAAGPSLAKTVRSWGGLYSQEKVSLED